MKFNLRFISNVILLQVLLLTSPLCALASTTRQPDTLFIVSASGNFPFNNQPQPEDYIPVPVLFFQKKNLFGLGGRTTMITGGLFNQLQWDSNADQGFGVRLGFTSLALFAGDSVKIDGNRFGEQFDFQGNFQQARVGATYQTSLFDLPLRFALDWLGQYQNFFNREANVSYTFIDDFWMTGPSLQIDYGLYLPDLPIPYLLKATLFARHGFRFKDKPWGSLTNPYQAADPTHLEFKVRGKFSLNDRFSIWSDLYATTVFNADRISAVSRGTNFVWEEFDQLFLRDIKSDRSLMSRAKLQYAFNDSQTLAVHTGLFVSLYRELLLGTTRNQISYGFTGGLSGKLTRDERFYWDLKIGTAQGINENQWIHEAGLKVSWRFKP
jgi:hypothetical protein